MRVKKDQVNGLASRTCLPQEPLTTCPILHVPPLSHTQQRMHVRLTLMLHAPHIPYKPCLGCPTAYTPNRAPSVTAQTRTSPHICVRPRTHHRLSVPLSHVYPIVCHGHACPRHVARGCMPMTTSSHMLSCLLFSLHIYFST